MTVLVDARPLVDPRAGGVGRVAAGLLPALVDAMPHDRFVFLTSGLTSPPDQGGDDRDERSEGVPRVVRRHVRLPNKLLSLACLLGLTSFDRWTKTKPDLLLLPNIGWVGRPRIPYFLIVHDLSFLIEPRWFNFKSRWWHRAVRAKRLIKNAAHLFAVSERTKRDVMDYLRVPSDSITVIPMGLPALPRYPLLVTDPPPPLINRRYVLALGADDPRKNAGCAMAAVEELRRDPQFADVGLVVTGVGAGLVPALGSDRPADRRATARVAPTIFLQHPSDDALICLMRHASAFLYPSWYEGFGLPLHEAARFGTPCLASTAGALPETAPSGTLFAPPSKPHLWSTALQLILTDPAAHQTHTVLQAWTSAARSMADGLRST